MMNYPLFNSSWATITISIMDHVSRDYENLIGDIGFAVDSM